VNANAAGDVGVVGTAFVKTTGAPIGVVKEELVELLAKPR